MSRTAILPFPGDPLLLNFWLDFYRKYWADEVDSLVIHMNSFADKFIIDYCQMIVSKEKNASIDVTPNTVAHGESIDMMLEFSNDHVVLMEDDVFVFKKGVIDEQFKKIESGQFDAVGSQRASCHQWITDTSKKKFNLDYSGLGDRGCNFWPALFFIDKKHLLATDRLFDSRAWEAGEMFEPFGEVAPEQVIGDTFVSTSQQLRAMGLNFGYIPQHHCYTDDLPDYNAKKGIFAPGVPYIHVGSLSSGFNGFLRDEFNRSLGTRRIEPKKEKFMHQVAVENEDQKKEIERRLTFYTMALEHYRNNPNGGELMDGFANDYEAAMLKASIELKLKQSRVLKRTFIYKKLWQI